ncbi:MAG: sulfite exporter TauE/SafE family protein [Desulfobacterales bacterium]|nr:sulfite exporter TauE/SafE family protein [Desulfobacterales bacterium]
MQAGTSRIDGCDSMLTYIAVGFVLFLAGFIQGLSGFGAILMSLPLLAVFLDIKTVIPLAALAAQAITLMILNQLKHHLDWKKILPLLFLGTYIGGRFYGRIDEILYRRIMMVLLAGLGVLMIVRA